MGKKGRQVKPKQEFMDEKEDLHYAIHSNHISERFYDKINKDEHQIDYYNSLVTNRMTIVDDPSGTGKTTIAFKAGLDLLKDGEISKIVYIRFPSKRGEGLGFTTGDLKDKQAKYMKPAYQCLYDLGLSPENVEEMKVQGLLELITDAEERGMTRDKEFAIIDESQNAVDMQTLNLVLSRFTDASKIALIGHSLQADNNNKFYTRHRLTAFQVYQYHYMKKSWVKRCRLVKNYRGEMSRWSDEYNRSIKELDAENLEPKNQSNLRAILEAVHVFDKELATC